MLDLSHVCDPHHSSQQCRILSPLREARDQTSTSWMLVRFVSTESQWELLSFPILFVFFKMLIFFLFWSPHDIWSSWAGGPMWAPVVTCTGSFNTLCQAGDQTCTLALQRCHWSRCTMTETPAFFFWVYITRFASFANHCKTLCFSCLFSICFKE